MSLIPPNIISSVIQSAAATREQSKDIDVARTAQAEAARRAATGPDAFVDIEATDTDNEVHTDSGGLGSQGRQDAKPDNEVVEEAIDSVTQDADGQAHLDLSA